MYSVILQFQARPAYRQNVREALLADARLAPAHEEGTLRFEVIEDETRPNEFYVIAIYRDRAAFDTHFAGPHCRWWHGVPSEPWLAVPVSVLGRGTILYPPPDIGTERPGTTA